MRGQGFALYRKYKRSELPPWGAMETMVPGTPPPAKSNRDQIEEDQVKAVIELPDDGEAVSASWERKKQMYLRAARESGILPKLQR
jgi:hypothetical protein